MLSGLRPDRKTCRRTRASPASSRRGRRSPSRSAAPCWRWSEAANRPARRPWHRPPLPLGKAAADDAAGPLPGPAPPWRLRRYTAGIVAAPIATDEGDPGIQDALLPLTNGLTVRPFRRRSPRGFRGRPGVSVERQHSIPLLPNLPGRPRDGRTPHRPRRYGHGPETL